MHNLEHDVWESQLGGCVQSVCCVSPIGHDASQSAEETVAATVIRRWFRCHPPYSRLKLARRSPRPVRYLSCWYVSCSSAHSLKLLSLIISFLFLTDFSSMYMYVSRSMGVYVSMWFKQFLKINSKNQGNLQFFLSFNGIFVRFQSFLQFFAKTLAII